MLMSRVARIRIRDLIFCATTIYQDVIEYGPILFRFYFDFISHKLSISQLLYFLKRIDHAEHAGQCSLFLLFLVT